VSTIQELKDAVVEAARYLVHNWSPPKWPTPPAYGFGSLDMKIAALEAAERDAESAKKARQMLDDEIHGLTAEDRAVLDAANKQEDVGNTPRHMGAPMESVSRTYLDSCRRTEAAARARREARKPKPRYYAIDRTVYENRPDCVLVWGTATAQDLARRIADALNAEDVRS